MSSLSSVMQSLVQRHDEILTLSPNVAIILASKYPDVIEKEPILQEFIKKANPRSLSIDHIKSA